MELIELTRYFSLAGFVLWALGERAFALAGQQQEPDTSLADKSYWLINISWYGTMLFTFIDIWYLGWTEFGLRWPLRGAGLLLILGGLLLRWRARSALGRQYSVRVETSEAHRLVETGIFRVIRHPAYLGLLCLFVGIPLCGGSWGGLILAMIAGLPSILYRIHKEENALLKWFGARYGEYRRRTWRLLPYLW